MKETTEQVKKVPNPTGKGGFQDHPELINAGGRPKNQESFAYWMNQFKNMTVEELEKWQKNTPKNVRTVAADLAFRRVFNAQEELNEFREVADRTEGKATQPIEIDTNVKKLEDIIDELTDDKNTETSEDKDPS